MVSKTEKVKKLLAVDKRTTERLNAGVSVHYLPEGAEKWVTPISLCDISGGGIRFIISHPLDKNIPISLKIDLLDGQSPIVCDGDIVWRENIEQTKVSARTAPKDKKGYAIGVKFYNMPPEDKKRFVLFLSEKILLKYVDSWGAMNERR
jgi:hypothetical protein